MTHDGPDKLAKIVRLMEMQKRSLTEAGADDELMRLYAAIIRRVAGFSESEIGVRSRATRSPSFPSSTQLAVIDKLSLDEIERLAKDESTPRRTLETIAIKRFNVPQGSMRSFSNIELLKAKILTRIQNERTHSTIRSLANRGRKEV